MAIIKDEIIALAKRFHEVVMIDKGSAAQQAAFFLHPDPRIYILHGEDISMEQNYEIHQKLADERHEVCAEWQVTPLCEEPERVHAVGRRLLAGPAGRFGQRRSHQGNRGRGLDRPANAHRRTQVRALHQLVPPFPARLGGD